MLAECACLLLLARCVFASLHCDFSGGLPKTQLFSQLEDHSSSSSGVVFQQQFWVNDYYYQPGGPLLFYAGPESAIYNYSLACLALPLWAKQLNAVMVAVEHRNFGLSQPASKWQYLTLDNILADYAAVASSVAQQYNDAKVIAFGGSYGGFLSMALRVRHPEVFLGSIASAAPVYLYGSGVVSDGAWYDEVALIYQKKNASCAESVSAEFKEIADLLSAGEYTSVQQKLNLCSAPTASSALILQIYLQHATQLVTQFNYPWKSACKVAFPFQTLCSSQTSTFLPTALDLAYNVTGALKCFWNADPSSSSTTAVMKPFEHALMVRNDITFESSWGYICCNWYVMPIDGGSIAKSFYHFDHVFYFDGVSKYCQSTFGVTMRSTPILSVAEIQNSSQILFTNMGYDPVQAFSLQADLSDTITMKIVSEAGHTQDICAPADGEVDEVIQFREMELELMREWLQPTTQLSPEI
eukprot:TRINITY_DN3388_c0_g1_i1.p1 TRINITY_DN3388_c0_g1~~TRINITY_DN3388_c0_g1_i1.p1  ORF type:complete len:469 (-),score=117.69 TRINITY_DN3388_c0_g1_i1:115-1521(-)